MEKQCLIIFGPTAAGKTYLGHHAQEKGWHWIEGDDLIKPDLKNKIATQQFTIEDLVPFFNDLLAHVVQTLETQSHIVMTQTLSRQRFRQLFRDKLPMAKFIFVDTPMELALARSKKRNNWADDNVVRKAYELLQRPENPDYIINNNTEGKIPASFDTILKRHGSTHIVTTNHDAP